MVENVSELPVKKGKIERSSTVEAWPPFESLRQEINRMFDDFGGKKIPFAPRTISNSADSFEMIGASMHLPRATARLPGSCGP
jgi:hypothetical protein